MCANLVRYAFISYLTHSFCSQGSAQLTFSSNPVYNREPVTLTCGYGSGVDLNQVTVEAFNGTLKNGFLHCTPSTSSTSSWGIFEGKNFTGCPALVPGVTSVSVTLAATPLLELDYNCTARVGDGVSYYYVKSGRASLQVRVLPAVPKFIPHPLKFTNDAVVRCQALGANPPAVIRLTISSTRGTELTSTGRDSASLTLPPPQIYWNNATAACIVTNHNFPNMTTTSIIVIHRSALLTLSSNPVYSGEPVHLTCSYNTADPLFAVTIDAFNHTQKKGSLSCDTSNLNTTDAGVFGRKIPEKCLRSITSTNTTWSMTASPLLELDFNCTVAVILEDRSILELTSATVFLVVHVLPELPKFVANSLVLQEDGSASVMCESRNGKPGADLNLTISTPSGNLLTAVGTESVLLNVSIPLDWHNAKASCTVMNHIFPNLSTTSTIVINPDRSLRCEKCWILGPIMGGLVVAVVIIVSVCKRGHLSFRRKRKSSGLKGSQKQALVVNLQEPCVRDVLVLRECDEEYSSDRQLASAEAPYATLVAETKCDKLAYEALLL